MLDRHPHAKTIVLQREQVVAHRTEMSVKLLLKFLDHLKATKIRETKQPDLHPPHHDLTVWFRTDRDKDRDVVVSSFSSKRRLCDHHKIQITADCRKLLKTRIMVV